jgi:hypothetical protein
VIEFWWFKKSFHGFGFGHAHLNFDLIVPGSQLLYFFVFVFEREFLNALVGLFEVLKAFCQFAHVVSQFAHLVKLAEKLDVD